MMKAACAILHQLLDGQADATGRDWINRSLQQIREKAARGLLSRAFSAAPRYLSRTPLTVDAAAAQEFQKVSPGLRPEWWTLDQAARILLLGSYPYRDADEVRGVLRELLDTADMRESAALYAALPLLPFPEACLDLATDGVRTNMVVVFDAIALDNPYPALHFPEAAWNQLFLKAAFLGRPLYRIEGVDQRANADLARIVSDYAHERWAAGRSVTPEIWRPVSGFLNDRLLNDLERLFQSEDPLQRAAAALVCRQSGKERAPELVEKYPSASVENMDSWIAIGRAWAGRPVTAPEK